MSLRVKDLSGATQSAVRTTRRLGGFVAGADYSTGHERGQLAARRFAFRSRTSSRRSRASPASGRSFRSTSRSRTFRPGSTDSNARIATARKAGHKKQVTRLERRRAALVREGTYAKVALQLTTTKPTAKHVVPSRFDRVLG